MPSRGHEDLLSERLGQFLGNETAEHVGVAAGGKRNEQLDGFRGIALGDCGRGENAGYSDRDDEGEAAFHGWILLQRSLGEGDAGQNARWKPFYTNTEPLPCITAPFVVYRDCFLVPNPGACMVKII